MLSAVAARRAAKAALAPAPYGPENDPTATVNSDTPPPGTSQRPKPAPRQKRKRVPGNNSSRNQSPEKKRSAVAYREPETALSRRAQARETLLPGHAVAGNDEADESSSSSDEDIEGEVEDIGPSAQPVAATPPSLSTYHLHPDITYFPLTSSEASLLNLPALSSPTILILSPSKTLSFIGTANLVLLHGLLNLSGTTISPSPFIHPIFAPRSHPIPSLEPISQPAPLRADIPERVRSKCKESDTIIALAELDTGVQGLGNVCKVFQGVFDGPTVADWSIPGCFPIFGPPPHDISPFISPPEWRSALDVIMSRTPAEYEATPFVGLVRGTKKSGKSTFARTLANNLLTRYRKVAFLECDMGQSEFTPAGLVSLNMISRPLFGPPFTHPTPPHRAHYIGSSTPRSVPSHYLACITSLTHTYRLEVQYPIPDDSELDDDSDLEDSRIAGIVPLVVNTQGWTKGFGADLLAKIEEIVKPSAIFSFDMDGPAMARGSSAEREGCELYSLGGISSTLGNRYNASDLRALSILSYFHTNSTPSPHSSSTRFWDTILPLCAQPPWEVDLSCAAVDKIVLVGSGAEDVIEDELFRALNGSLVGLIAYDDGNNNNDDRSSADSSQEMARYSPGGTPPDPSSSRCLGLALIRSISPHPRTSPLLHILTPVPPTVLAKSRILVKGELELPIWGMLDFREDEEEKGTIGGVEYGVVPFLQWGAGRGVGGVPRRVRRNLMRRGQT